MKNNLYLLGALILLITISSCSRKEQPVLLPALKHVETIMYQYPDSALRVLEQMQMPKSSDHLNHATWCLFLAQAKYKNYIKQPSDSLINIAYDYFMEQGNPQRKALTLYLEGAIYEELHEMEKAIQFYLEAAEEVESTTDYQLGHLIYVGLGQIYNSLKLYAYAKNAFEKSYDYAKQSEYDRYITNSLLLFGRLYLKQGDWDNAIKYYEEAIHISSKNGNDRTTGRIFLEMASIYRNKKDYATALKYAQKEFTLKSKDDPDFYQSYLTIGNIHYSMNNADSAHYYLHKALSSSNLYIQKSAYGTLFLLNRAQKKYEDAFNYVEQYQVYSDSIQRIQRADAIVEIQEKYDKEKLLNEKSLLQIKNDQTLRTALLVLILLLCIIAVIIYRYQRRLLQKERTIQKNEEQIRLYTLKICENETLISRNEGRIHELFMEMEQNQEIHDLLEEQKRAISEIQYQNKVLCEENEVLQRNVSQYSSTLQEKVKELDTLKVLAEENLRLQDRERFLSNQLLKDMKVLNDLKTSPRYLDATSWEEIKKEVNWLYADYTVRLTEKLPSLTESDLQICCLIKLRLPIPETAILLGISPASVSKRKQRLKERILQDLGEPFGENKTLDLWLWEY